MQVYSFRDMTGAYIHPLGGQYILGGGNVGLGQITITMATTRTVTSMSADGTPMVSYIAGDNGSLAIECQQTSDLHQFLLTTFNSCKVAADAGDVSNWAAGLFSFRTMVDGSSHVATGVSFEIVPPKVYGKEGQMLTWVLAAAKIVNE